MFPAVLLSLALFQSPQQPTPPMGTPKPLTDEKEKVEKCIIEGKVTSTVDGMPLKKATVTLLPQPQPGTVPRPMSNTTDADGKFIFRDLDPARYVINVARNGYARQSYGQRVPNGPGTTLTLSPGQHLKDINVRLTPGAAINGRIVDEDNDPVSGAFVSVMRWGYIQGKRQLINAGGGGSTDDRGQFRIHSLSPGRYFVSATYRGANPFMTMTDANPKESEETYAPTYYPGTFEVAQASPVEVKPGDDIMGIVFRLSRAHAVRVSGSARNADGQPLKAAMVQLLPRSRGFMSSMDMMMRNTDEKGNFNISGVMPGSYIVLVRGSMDQQQIFGRADLDVGTNAVDNVVVTASSGSDLEAVVQLDGSVDLTKANVRLFLAPDEVMMPIPASSVQVKEAGNVTLPKVYDGNYTVRAGPLPDDAYVSKAIFDEKDALSEAIKIRGGGGRFEVTISAAGAHVEGTVYDKDHQPFPSAQVVLVPEESKRSRIDLFRTATSDQNGHFVLRGIPPGTYKLFAWESIDFGAYQDPDFLKAFDDQGKTLRLGAGDRPTPELKVIPSAKSGS